MIDAELGEFTFAYDASALDQPNHCYFRAGQGDSDAGKGNLETAGAGFRGGRTRTRCAEYQPTVFIEVHLPIELPVDRDAVKEAIAGGPRVLTRLRGQLYPASRVRLGDRSRGIKAEADWRRLHEAGLGYLQLVAQR